MEDADNYKRNHGMPSNTTLTAICNNFCDVIEKNGYYAGVYASQSWFNNQIKGITKYDKWIANWELTTEQNKKIYQNYVNYINILQKNIL